MRDVSQQRSYSVGFAELRQRFRNAAERASAELIEYLHPLHGPAGEVLATDVALLGQRDAPKLLVLISGTHGVEGQFGSACQTAWLEENTPWQLPKDTALLFIHLINPWGTAWSRRVNEDNVDLNRNFIDWQSAPPKNENYASLHQALVCHEWEGPDRNTADEALAAVKKKLGGHAGLARIVEAGQYEFPDGLFYGGDGPVWSNRTLNDILARFAGEARQVVVFDMHTGAGPYGYPALLSVAETDHAGLAWGKSIFGPALSVVLTGKVATTDTGIAATATGYVSAAVRQAMPRGRVLPLVVECGTLDGPAVMEAVQADNWLHLFGKVDTPLGQRIKATLRSAFIPEDPDWQWNSVANSLRYFDRALADLKAVNGAMQDQPLPAPKPATATVVQPHPQSTARPTAAVEVVDLHKSFGQLEVLSGVSLSASAGEVVSMIGSSGSGKSTFLRCINLLEQPNGGRIVIDGEEIG
jgi:polar amino acid transport system ATP-binding protein